MYSWIARDAGMEEICAEGGSSYLLLNLGFKACSEYSLLWNGAAFIYKGWFQKQPLLAF